MASIVAVLVDTLTHVGLGPISASGLVTLVLAAGFVAASPMLVGRAARWKLPLPLMLFIVYIAVRLLLEPSSDGLQMLAVWTIFGFGTSFSASRSSSERAGATLVLFTVVAIVLCGVFLFQLSTGTVIYITRGFALTALVLLAAAVMVPSQKQWAKAAPFFVLGAIVVSLSRTASLIGLAVLIGLVARRSRGKRLVLAGAGLGGVGAAILSLVNLYPPFRERFLGGDNAFQVGDLSFNTSGRSNIWDAVLADAMSDPWLGHGPGSSVALVTQLFAPVLQPHNEYLRLFHDLGYVGVVLFALGMVSLLYRIANRAARTDAPIHWAALLALSAVLLAAATDNVFVYPFVMFPLSILVGLSLGLPDAKSRSRLRHDSKHIQHRRRERR